MTMKQQSIKLLLTSVTIGNSVASIGNCAFLNCGGLKTVTIGNSVKSIGTQAFSGCQSLKHFAFGSQALDDINKWECQLFVPTGALTSYQEADQWKEFF